MYRTPDHLKTHRKNRKLKTILITLLAIFLVGLLALWLRPATSEAPEANRDQPTEQPQEPEEITATPIDLQPTVEAWEASQPGNYGIVVYDHEAEQIIASHQPDEQFFTASIYKLYVAYLTLMDFQSGDQDPNEVILAGQTRKECVYKMIHSSDSPCGETVLNNIGGVTLTNRLKDVFGFTATSFPAFQTSAGDTNRLLVRLHATDDLNAENKEFLLDAMRTQVYRTGLPAGMPDATVADKVGFDSPDLWMDTGIVTLPNGKNYSVTIYGNGGVGSKQISDFGRTIYTKLTEE